MVARLSSTPCLAQIFSCRARGTPSTYFFVITSATVEGDARECFIRGGGVLVVMIWAMPVAFAQNIAPLLTGLAEAGSLRIGKDLIHVFQFLLQLRVFLLQ